MKILVVCQYYYPENFVISNICEELVAKGNDVTVLTGKPNYGYGYIIPEYKKVSYEVINGVKVHRVNLVERKKSRLSIIRNYLSFWSNSKKWVRKCKEKFDIVYSMSLSPVTILSAGNLYKKMHNVKHVVHCVDLWPESVLVTHAVKEKSLFYNILYKWSKSLYSKVDKVLLGSPSFKQYFDNVLQLNIDSEFVPQPSLIEKSDIEPYKYGDGFNILYCGNLGRIQMIPTMIEAMKLVQNKNIKLHVIGMGPLSNYLEKEIINNNLQDRIIYHGPIIAKKAAAYFKSADAFYVSLEDKGYVGKTIPNKLVMYMAFGKPIIGCLGGDGKSIIEEAECGQISQQNPAILAQTFEKMASLSKEEKEKLGTNAQAYHLKVFSLKAISNKINELLSNELR